jgi:hypothetical protein
MGRKSRALPLTTRAHPSNESSNIANRESSIAIP